AAPSVPRGSGRRLRGGVRLPEDRVRVEERGWVRGVPRPPRAAVLASTASPVGAVARRHRSTAAFGSLPGRTLEAGTPPEIGSGRRARRIYPKRGTLERDASRRERTQRYQRAPRPDADLLGALRPKPEVAGQRGEGPVSRPRRNRRETGGGRDRILPHSGRRGRGPQGDPRARPAGCGPVLRRDVALRQPAPVGRRRDHAPDRGRRALTLGTRRVRRDPPWCVQGDAARAGSPPPRDEQVALRVDPLPPQTRPPGRSVGQSASLPRYHGFAPTRYPATVPARAMAPGSRARGPGGVTSP